MAISILLDFSSVKWVGIQYFHFQGFSIQLYFSWFYLQFISNTFEKVKCIEVFGIQLNAILLEYWYWVFNTLKPVLDHTQILQNQTCKILVWLINFQEYLFQIILLQSEWNNQILQKQSERTKVILVFFSKSFSDIKSIYRIFQYLVVKDQTISILLIMHTKLYRWTTLTLGEKLRRTLGNI